MTEKKYIEKNNLSNTLKLRHYIIDIIYHNNQKSVKIPSIRQLAADFKLAKSTVQLIQEELVQEGYLYSKKGIGTFTNPSMGFVAPHGTPPPLIGIIWGDGKLYFHDHYISRTLGAIASSITEDGWNCRNISLTSTNPAEIIEELCGISLDGLIWHVPPPDYFNILEQLNDQIPFIAVSNSDKYKDFNRVTLDFDAIGYKLGKELIKEHRKTMLTAVAGVGLSQKLKGLRRALSESNVKESCLNEIPSFFYKELDEYLTVNPPPDILAINGRHADFTMQILKKHKIDPVNQCRIIALQHVISPANFIGLFLNEPFESRGKAVAEIMKKMLESNPRPSPRQICLPVKITNINLQQVYKETI